MEHHYRKDPTKSFQRLTDLGQPPHQDRASSGTITWHEFKKNMAAVGRLFRLSTFTVAAGAALKISKDVTDRRRNSSQNSNLELVLVQIAFRHGARTPIFPAPCQELEPVTWQADLLMGPLPHTVFDYELKHVSGGARPFSRYDDRQMKKILKVMYCLYCLTLGNNYNDVSFHVYRNYVPVTLKPPPFGTRGRVGDLTLTLVKRHQYPFHLRVEFRPNTPTPEKFSSLHVHAM